MSNPYKDFDDYGLSHFPAHLHKAELWEELFEHIGSDLFRRQQLDQLDQPRLVTEGIDYAVDVAVQRHDPVELIRFSMLRVNDTVEWFKSDLSQLVTIGRERPQRAREVATLIPEPAIRRMALVLLAWSLYINENKREFVGKLVTEAVGIRAPATLGQTPVLLEMTRELYCAGFGDAKGLIRAIPNNPVRQMYQTAWEYGQEHVRALAITMKAVASDVPETSAEEMSEFVRIREFVQKLSNQLKRGMKPGSFEDHILDMFGPDGISEAYFLMAVERIHAGDFRIAQASILRGIFQGCPFPLPAIRTLCMLMELFDNAGEHDLAEEQASRIRTVSKMLKRVTKQEQDFGRVQDALSDFRIASDNAAHIWRPSGVDALLEHSLSSQHPQGVEGELDTLVQLANARQLLATGHTRTIPVILQNIVEKLECKGDENLSITILISIYAMARACKNEVLASTCAKQLQKCGLSVEALHSSEDRTEQTFAVLKTMAGADPRCVASVSLCLRLEGLNQRLFEFAQVASNSGASIEILDAILSQVVRVSDIESTDLRLISESILKTTAKSIHIPSGFGWYYYPGIMLLAAWSGVIMISLGLRAASAIPRLLTFGIILVLAEFIGGSIDLVIWRFIRLWEKPEKSRHQFLPELASLASPWLILLLLRPWVRSMPYTHIGIGALVAFFFSGLLGILVGRKGWLFIPLSKKVIVLGTVMSLILAGGLVAFLPVFLGNLALSAVCAGIFLAGMLEIGICLNIIPKRIAVLRYYHKREIIEEKSPF